jgi:4-hydroxybenzoate polyprenyltransferase
MLSESLRIVADVVTYRLRKLEMANLVAAVAIMVALRLPPSDVACRAAFAVVLNLLVYLNNDYCDVEQDLAAGRESEKTRFLAAHLGTALGVQLALVAILVVTSLLWNVEMLLPVVAGGGMCVLYSAWLKRVPFADVAAMAAWGVGMTLVAFPLGSRLGWALVVELGLFSSVFETIQVIRDHDGDRACGVTTTAVRLGPARALSLARAFMVLSAAYGIAVLERHVGIAMLVAPLVPFTDGDPGRYWTRVRLVLGLAWLGVLAVVAITGTSSGFLVHIPR